MRKISINYFIATFLSTVAYCQNYPNGQALPMPSASVSPLPAAYNNASAYNYTRIWDVKMPSTSLMQIVQSTNVKDVLQTTEYNDGVSKLIQTVKRGATSNGNDIVTPKTYDNAGREVFLYPSYPSTTSDGKMKLNPFGELSSFIQGQSQYSGEQVYYGKTIYDNSPLSLIEKTMKAGNSYAGSDRGSQIKYESNTNNEVKIWDVSTAIGSIPNVIGSYDPGTLYRGTTIDVNGKRVITYKDKEGKLLLKKVEIATSGPAVITDYPGWLCTYYIYDEVGNLRYTIPPRAVEWLVTYNWVAMPQNIVDALCFRFEYDDKKRLVTSKAPGADEISSVYDYKDRPILFRDGNLTAAGLWQYTIYDNQDRVIEKGLWTNAQTRIYHQQQADNYLNYVSTVYPNNEVLEQIYYDNYSILSTCGCGLPSVIDASQLNGSWLNTTPGSQFPYAKAITQTQQTLNLTTVSKTKILNSSPAKYLYSVTFYDDAGNIIQSISTNITGGTDIVTTQYGYGGKVLAIHTQHNYIAGSNTQTQNIYSRNEYDNVGRILQTFKRINNDAEKIQTNSIYNEQGQLSKIELGKNITSGLPIETIDYSYTLNGELRSINQDFVNGLADNRFFGEIINRDYGFVQPQYNGNISGVQWRGLGSGERRAYGYKYDPANRILTADFTQFNGGWNTSANIDFSQKLGNGTDPTTAYDANSNILSMSQKALKMYQSEWVDLLTYQYDNNYYSNRLVSVSEASSAGTASSITDNVLGDFKDNQPGTPSNDYGYDLNGNITSDYNKGITSILYNHFNKPTQITIQNKGMIKYVYDATGQKLQKIIIPNVGNTVTYNYCGAFNYKDDQLQFILTEQGRMRPLPIVSGQPTFAYDYFEKDHLGNIRAILTDEKRTDIYVKATLEAANSSNEQLYYDNVTTALVTRPGAFGTSSNNGLKVQLLQKNAQSIGVSKLMKVMVKDQINVTVEYYFPAQTTDNSGANGASSLLTMLQTFFNSPGAPAALAGKGIEITQQLNNSSSNPFNIFLNPQTPNQPSSSPKAYLNVLFFDEQFRFVSTNSVFVGVTVSGSLQTITIPNIEVPKNGYVYAYVSNESNNLVYFDNFQVSQIRGPLLEENHYNLLGAKMTGLCSKSNPAFANSFAFQGKILDEEFDLDWSDFGARNYDAQIGRFMQLDPADQFASGYTGMGNNWANGTDPTGALFGIDDVVVMAVGFVYGYISSGIKNGNWGLKALGNGLLNAAIFEIGYLTAGGGLAATGGAATADVTVGAVTTTAAQTAMNTATTYLVNTAINMAVGQLIPPIPLKFGSFTILLSPSLSSSGVGINIGANYSDENISIGISYGLGQSTGTSDLSTTNNFSSVSKGLYSSFGGSFGVKSNGKEYGGSFGFNNRKSTAGQKLGVIGIQIGDFGIRLDEDFVGDKHDRFYTGGTTLTYKLSDDITVAFGLGMITGQVSAEGHKESNLIPQGPNGTYNSKYEILGAFRSGAIYAGIIYKGYSYFGGVNSERVLHGVQNWIHTHITKTTPFFENLHKTSLPWSYFGNYNIMDIIY